MMILIDIYVPALDQVYDFKVEESCTFAVIAEEICEMIQQKEQLQASRMEESMIFFDGRTKRMLPLDQTPWECHISDGCRLILV